MEPIYGVLFCSVVLIFGVGVIIAMQATNGGAKMELAEDFKVRGRPYSRNELRERQSGNYVPLGRDTATNQEYIHPHQERTSHLLNLGPTRVGKSEYNRRTFHPYDVAYRHNANIFFDPQLDLTNGLIGMFTYYHRPFTVFPEAGFNPLGGPGRAAERAKLFADLFLQAGEFSTEGDGTFYRKQVQLFLLVIVPLYEATYHQPMIPRELLVVALSKSHRQQLLADAKEVVKKGSEEEKRSARRELDEYTLYLGGWSEKDFDANLKDLVLFIRTLCHGNYEFFFNQRHAKSLAEAIDEQQCIIIRAGGERGSLERIPGLLFMIALQDYANRRPVLQSNHRVNVHIEEAPYYLNQNFHRLVATVGKKEMVLHLSFQNLDQLGDFRETILGNIRSWVIHTDITAEDAEYVTSQVGERAHFAISQSRQIMESPDKVREEKSI